MSKFELGRAIEIKRALGPLPDANRDAISGENTVTTLFQRQRGSVARSERGRICCDVNRLRGSFKE